MRAIHKRADGAFLSCAAALLFLAACAWCGAWLCARLRPAALPAAETETETTGVLPLAGICLRREEAFCPPASAALAVEDGERVPTGGLLARLPDGTPLCAGTPALFFRGVDGLEALDIAALEPFGVSSLRALLAREAFAPSGCRGRLVLDGVWYYAALAPAGAALPEPGACRIRFDGKTEWLPARLLAVSDAEAGERALLFRLSRGGDYLSLRRVGAELHLT